LLYDRLLLTDTMGGYNFALVNGAEDSPRFSQISNPVDRQSIAMREGINNLLAHPERLAEEIVPNARHLLRLEETYRLLSPQNPDPIGDSARGLIFDDGILLAIVLLASWGIVYIPERHLSVLLLLWIGYSLVLLIVVFFGQVRFRWPLVPFLAPYAAYGFHVLRKRELKPLLAWRNGLVLVLCALVLGLIAWDYPVRIVQVVTRENALARASAAERAGQMDVAARDLDQARAIDPGSLRVEIALGDFYRASGDLASAVEAYRHVISVNDDSLAASWRLFDLYRTVGQIDRAALMLGAPGDDDAPLLDRAWEHPEVSSSIPSRVDVGTLDVGYVHWMYPREKLDDDGHELTFRWTSSLAQIRLRAPSSNARVLSLRLNAFRPEGMPRPKLTVSVSGRELQTLVVRRIWQVYNMTLPSDLDLSQPLIVTLRSDVWIAKGEGQITPPRRLGVQVDWIQISEMLFQQGK
jgi:hypothetical protein